jgi:hypothetical protein
LDAQAPLGVATHDVAGRIMASRGKGGPVDSRFEPRADAPKAGVLPARPALLARGLWEHTGEHVRLPSGYYQRVPLFLLAACRALARVKSLESLRYCAPGEWGKVLGLDRIPEGRTLREKLPLLGEAKKVSAWAAQLSRQWMAEDPQSAGALYVDGPGRVYHGSAARLPKHDVSRPRLGLRATTDYWVNAADGQPFFVGPRPGDPGRLKVLEEEILPRLEKEVPHQPAAEALAADPTLDKFIVVFDREGDSPEGLKRLKARRIGCLTDHKHPGADWPETELQTCTVKLAHGNQAELKLAERRTQLSNDFEVREIRHLDATGHQTAGRATPQQMSREGAAAGVFGRWSQEHVLQYMREHDALDRLVSCQVEQMDATTQAVNPAWRKLDRAVRRLTAKLQPRLARFGAMHLAETIEPEAVEKFLKKQAALQREVQERQTQRKEKQAERAGGRIPCPWDKYRKPGALIGSAAAARTGWTPSSWWRIGPRRRWRTSCGKPCPNGVKTRSGACGNRFTRARRT